MHRCRLFYYFTFFSAFSWFLMYFLFIYTLHQHSKIFWKRFYNSTGFALVFACYYFYFVSFFYFHVFVCFSFPPPLLYLGEGEGVRLYYFGCQGNDCLMSGFGDFSWNRTKYSAGFRQDLTLFLLHHNNRIFIKTDIGTILSFKRCFLADYQTQKYRFFLNFFARFSFLNGKNNQFADSSVSFFGTAQYLKDSAYFGS